MAEEHVWYLGIGSMMSLTALRLRGVYPRQSQWCEILDYRRVHYPRNGMATLVPEAGSTAHAVAHEMTAAELAIIEAREPPSIQVRARLNGTMSNTTVAGHVSVARFVDVTGVQCPFAVPSNDDPPALLMQRSSGASGYIVNVTRERITVLTHGLQDFDCVGIVTGMHDVALGVPTAVLLGTPVSCPTTARYRDLMVEGARAVGMDAAIVDAFNSVACIPRKPLADFNKLRRNPAVGSCLFSEEDIRPYPERLAVFRGMVLQCPKSGGTWIKPAERHEALDSCLRISKHFYDPLYGVPPDDPKQPWAGWAFIEEWACGSYLNWKHVGWLRSHDDSTLVSKL